MGFNRWSTHPLVGLRAGFDVHEMTIQRGEGSSLEQVNETRSIFGRSRMSAKELFWGRKPFLNFSGQKPLGSISLFEFDSHTVLVYDAGKAGYSSRDATLQGASLEELRYFSSQKIDYSSRDAPWGVASLEE